MTTDSNPWIVERKTTPTYSLRGEPYARPWYCIAFTGSPAPSWLINGRTCGSYKFKRDALAAAAVMNARPMADAA